MDQKKIEAMNDCVIRFAHINGTGSASANQLLAKSFLRMGVRFGAKNMFPSNIQGLPTWFELRVNDRGHTGRRGGVDLMVAMNPQTFAEDHRAVDPGGYLMFDATKPLAENQRRRDITYLAVPITEICRQYFSDGKIRGLLKNIFTIGFVGGVLGIDESLMIDLVCATYRTQPKLLDWNTKALSLGFHEACSGGYREAVGIKVTTGKGQEDRIYLSGNQAAALGCLYAGATFAAWYPITPSTSLVDAFSRYCHRFRIDPVDKKHRFAIVQGEDEIASLGMVLGASWNGCRGFTATSGPGISLMMELIGYGYYAEIPAVIFNVQRTGPSTGMPTRNQHADLVACAYASHGDTKHLLIFPGTVKECFDFAVQAFDLADRFQTPVFVMSDLELAMNDWVSAPLKWDDSYQPDRGKVLSAEELEALDSWYRYEDRDGDGIPYRTLPMTHPAKGANLTRGSGHDQFGRYTENGALYRENLDRLTRKLENAVDRLPDPIVYGKTGDVGLICLGTTLEPLQEAVDLLLQETGKTMSIMRIRSFPFSLGVEEYIDQCDTVIVVEQSRDAQLRKLLVSELPINGRSLKSVLVYDGLPLTAGQLSAEIRQILG